MPKRPWAAVVRSYVSSDKPRLDALLESYSSLPTLAGAISRAALALDERGKRHRHQRRLKRQALEDARAALLVATPALSQAPSFDAIFAIVETATGPIKGLGDLYSYDTALRIGAYLGLDPTTVYLHAGARRGATKVGLDSRDRALPVSRFPAELASLKPRDIENLLCIYKGDL